MIVVKCAWCKTVIETKGDQSIQTEEVELSLCSVCETKVLEAEETDFTDIDTYIEAANISLLATAPH